MPPSQPPAASVTLRSSRTLTTLPTSLRGCCEAVACRARSVLSPYQPALSPSSPLPCISWHFELPANRNSRWEMNTLLQHFPVLHAGPDNSPWFWRLGLREKHEECPSQMKDWGNDHITTLISQRHAILTGQVNRELRKLYGSALS